MGASSLRAGNRSGTALSGGFTEASGDTPQRPQWSHQCYCKEARKSRCKAQPAMQDFTDTPGLFLIPGCACSILIASPTSLAAKKPNASQQPIIYPDTASLCSQEEFKHLPASCLLHPKSSPRD